MTRTRSAVVLAILPVATSLGADASAAGADDGAAREAALRARLETALDKWCRWLSGYLYNVPGTDLYTLNPTLGTGNNPYRDVAGNDFAAAAGAWWLAHARPDESLARPIRGLIKLALGTHVANKTIDRPDIQKWGSTFSFSDDWHACLQVAAIAMLSQGALPPDMTEQVRRMVAWEADHRTKLGISKEGNSIPGLMPEHSHGESNAWTATLLQLARTMFPDSPREEAWREAAITFSLNAICVPDDAKSDRVVAGKPLRSRVRGANFEPHGIQEHHGFYHPGYTAWPLAYAAYSMVLDEALPEPRRNPDVYLHNWKMVYDRMKQGTLHTGRFVHAAGDDWITYGYGNSLMLPASIFAAVRFADPDASRIADQWLALMEKQQAVTGGATVSARLATFARLRVNDLAWYEAQDGCALAQSLWLLDRIDGRRMPPPSSAEEYDRRNVGTMNEPGARLVWHRDAHRWASMSWRSCYNEWQAIVQPVALPHLLKYNHNSVGLLQFMGGLGGAKIIWSLTEELPAGGFWSLGMIDRESKRTLHGTKAPLVRQYQALIALPEGPTILVDQCLALDQLWLQQTGALGMRLAADVFNGGKVTLTAGGREQSFPPHECRDTWHDLGTRQITIEKLLTIHAVAGEGTFQLLQKRRRPPQRDELLYPNDPFGSEESLLTHELYFGPPAYDRLRIVSPNEWFRNDVLVFYCDPARTPTEPTAKATGRPGCMAIKVPEATCTVAVNFTDGEESVATESGQASVPARSVRILQ